MENLSATLGNIYINLKQMKYTKLVSLKAESTVKTFQLIVIDHNQSAVVQRKRT